MSTRTRESIKSIGAGLAVAAIVALAGPAMTAQADMYRGGVSSTSSGCWAARNNGIAILQSQGYHVTYTGRCVYLNDGYWHYTLGFTDLKQNNR